MADGPRAFRDNRSDPRAGNALAQAAKGLALDNSIAEWEEAYRSLVLGVRVLVGAVLPGMRERGWGRIVNIGSSSTVEPIPSLTLSNAHRLAAIGFLKTLSREVAGDGITINTVATGKFKCRIRMQPRPPIHSWKCASTGS